MSALGQKRTFARSSEMSALPPKADIGEAVGDQQLCRLSPQQHVSRSLTPDGYQAVDEALQGWSEEAIAVATQSLAKGLKGDELLFDIAEGMSDDDFQRYKDDLESLEPDVLKALRRR